MKPLTPINKTLKRLPTLLSFMAASLLWVGCEKDYNYVEPPLTTPVSFSTDVYPIFNANCNSAPCHLNNTNSPDLTNAATAYAQMWVNDNGNVLVDTSNGGANAANSVLYKRMSSTSSPMPPGGKLSADKINLVLTWIQQGAKNN